MNDLTDAMGSLSINDTVENIIKQMTLEEKLDYIGGWNGFYIRPIPRLGVPELKMSDGSLGMRGSEGYPAISYPATIAMAACWDTHLAERFGTEIGRDARANGVHFILGPGMCGHRAPMAGRNFEYLSEDPYLTTRNAVKIIDGIQSQKVGATAKHFVCNEEEYNRFQKSSNVDERTLREIYFPPFEASVKEANVAAIMTSYNLLNGEYTAQSKWLIDEVAKKEWNYQGFVMSDWRSVYDGLSAAKAGLDIEMPFALAMNKKTLMEALQKKEISIELIDDKIRRILNTAYRLGFFTSKQRDYSISQLNKAGRAVALEIAQNGTVLLKNEASTLPLNKEKVKTLAVIGPRAAQLTPQGGGSSKVTPIIQNSFLQGISDHVGDDIDITYSRGIADLTQGYNGSTWGQNSIFFADISKRATGFNAEYFANITLEGAPALTRIDPAIDFKWRELSYVQGGPVNHYSARWTTTFFAPVAGEATFYISGSDSFRVKINGEVVIDKWNKPSAESFQWYTLNCTEMTPYQVVVEYYVDNGGQEIHFTMVPGKYTALDDAKAIAAKADAVVLCVGLSDWQEGEAWDRPFKLPEAQDQLIQTVLQANPNTTIVLTGGGNVDMSGWIDTAPALLHTWYPGQEGGKALAQILFGDVNPSGKLPITLEKELADNPTSVYKSYYDSDSKINYNEKLSVGYRYFVGNADKKPLFPFGHGLSYSNFVYGDLTITPLDPHNSTSIKVSFNIKNLSFRVGSEVAQLYIHQKNPTVSRPYMELKGFSKVNLKQGETKEVTMYLDARSFSYYDVETHQWKYDPDQFDILVGPSSSVTSLVATVTLKKMQEEKQNCIVS